MSQSLTTHVKILTASSKVSLSLSMGRPPSLDMKRVNEICFSYTRYFSCSSSQGQTASPNTHLFWRRTPRAPHGTCLHRHPSRDDIWQGCGLLALEAFPVDVRQRDIMENVLMVEYRAPRFLHLLHGPSARTIWWARHVLAWTSIYFLMLASSHSRMYCLSWALLIWSHSDDMVHIYLKAKKKSGEGTFI
jgi:hypothetical protein